MIQRPTRVWAAAIVATLVAGIAGPAFATPTSLPSMPWLDATKPAIERADLLLAAMNEDQKIHMLHGASSLIGTRIVNPNDPPSIGYIPAIPELRVPAFVMTDGPTGLRNGEKATVMPASIAVASSFDPAVAQETGTAIARDASSRGQDLLFAPGFNLARNPLAGRSFEYYGEDPLLAGKLAAATTSGIQQAGVMATLKHYVANNQETNRTQNSSNIDPRTLREIYEKPFQIAIAESSPAAVMCAYNKVNNTPACGNRDTLITDLRERMGFDGIVVTDYPAAWSPTDVKNGLNVELPWSFWTSPLLVRQAIAKGTMTWQDVDQRVRETLVQMFRFGLFDHPWDDNRNDRVREIKAIDPAPGNAVARDSLERGAVLLRNERQTLPIASGDAAPQRVLVVGEGAKKSMAGGGSSAGNAIVSDQALTQISKRLPNSKVIWKSAWDPVGIASEARQSDLVIVFATQISTELLDRPDLSFLPHMNNAVWQAAKNNPSTVVVTQIGGPVLMPWLDQTAAVLNVWYPGQAGGEATARLLFGETNPSGRLPQTFPASNSQFPANTPEQFPGAQLGHQANYTEGVFIGYRWYTSVDQRPLFPFGYGLSYTTFEYSHIALTNNTGTSTDSVGVNLTVTNTGTRAGAVVPQAYVSKPGEGMPKRELGAFTKVMLEPGESQTVRLEVSANELAYWDTAADRFSVRPGTYQISVGDHVNDLRLTLPYTVS